MTLICTPLQNVAAETYAECAKLARKRELAEGSVNARVALRSLAALFDECAVKIREGAGRP